LDQNTTGYYNTACGYNSLGANTTGLNNVGIGFAALDKSTTGNGNVTVGAYANDAGNVAGTVAIGYASLTNNLGNSNNAVGDSSLYYNTSGTNNVAFGTSALQSNTTGEKNVGIGQNAGFNITTGSSNVCLGYNAAKGQITTGDNLLYIARNNVAAGNDGCWIYGNSSGECIQGSNQTAWDTTSDRRLKKNIVDSSKGLTEINQLRVANFQYRTEDEIDMSEFPLAEGPHQVVLRKGDEKVYTGVIAQEIETVLPECIKVSEKGAKTVSTDPIMWALVNAVKELSAKVAALEAG